MNTKKCLFITGALAISMSTAFAQSGNLKKAKSAYTKYEEMGGPEAGEISAKLLKDAVEPIEEATQHEKTKDNPETWTVYSLIYSNLAFAEKNGEYAEKAIAGLGKATELDADKKNESNISAAKVTLRNFYQTTGYEEWKNENFKGAGEEFEKGLALVPGDTTLTYFGALAAIQTQDYPTAIKKYEELLPHEDHSEYRMINADLPKLYLSTGDTTNALKYAASAAEKFPEDNDIVLQNIELNLITGHEQEIIQQIEAQLQRETDNKTLYYYLGTAYGSSENDEKALQAYKKAIEIDPDYLEANLNTAAVIMNMANKALMDLNGDKSVSDADYNTRVEKIKADMGEAVPYLEKALSIDPKNTNALSNLKSYYNFIQDEEKANEVQGRLEAAR
ncbi:tetratricopeptide repeat protein [Sphingobacterium corticis]|uniref:Tetratricopeptide repeat protein n=1 Tax=Sphingobacterium corticis TaxID=1812823 RepID=A0ABW5NKJ9_9SPHI